MRKEELVQTLARERSRSDEDGPQAADAGAGPDGGRLRTGEQTSSSLKYSQEVTSPDEDPERPAEAWPPRTTR
jgi:hypothetical protein